MTSNRSLCHDFFYSGFDKNRNLRNFNISYEKHVVFSYATAIGFVVLDKNKEKVFLVSRYSMSKTTQRHISDLYRACPFDKLFVPMRYGEKRASVELVARYFLADLDYASQQKMSQAKYRLDFIECFKDAEAFSNRVYTIEGLEDYRPLFETLNDSEEVKKLKAEQRKKDAEKRKKEKEELDALLKENSYLDLVKLASYDSYSTTPLMRKVRDILNPQGFWSFVWLDGDVYRTSQGIRIPKQLGDVALKAWKAGKLKIGDKLDHYTVLKITNDFVKIGCHTIPVKNLKALI